MMLACVSVLTYSPCSDIKVFFIRRAGLALMFILLFGWNSVCVVLITSDSVLLLGGFCSLHGDD